MVNLACGFVGLPNVGKSTIFNALTKGNAPASNYPFCTLDPNVGIVDVPDERLAVLSDLNSSQKIVPAIMKFVDIAGLVKGASTGEGLGNKFLANIREVDAIVHIVRCFESDEIIHVSGDVHPIRDVETINLELILADLQMVEHMLAKAEKQAKNSKEKFPLFECLKEVQKHLNNNLPARTVQIDEALRPTLNSLQLLTSKKVLYVANISEEDLHQPNEYIKSLEQYAEKEGNAVLTICGKLEEELSRFPENERHELLEAMGLKEPGLHRLIKKSFTMLDLIAFLTSGEKETRSWPIKRGTTAIEAAGKIHTDIQKGFVRAEVIHYDDMVKYHGRKGAKEAGKVYTEGRDYIVCDGDVLLFLHS